MVIVSELVFIVRYTHQQNTILLFYLQIVVPCSYVYKNICIEFDIVLSYTHSNLYSFLFILTLIGIINSVNITTCIIFIFIIHCCCSLRDCCEAHGFVGNI